MRTKSQLTELQVVENAVLHHGLVTGSALLSVFAVYSGGQSGVSGNNAANQLSKDCFSGSDCCAKALVHARLVLAYGVWMMCSEGKSNDERTTERRTCEEIVHVHSSLGLGIAARLARRGRGSGLVLFELAVVIAAAFFDAGATDGILTRDQCVMISGSIRCYRKSAETPLRILSYPLHRPERSCPLFVDEETRVFTFFPSPFCGVFLAETDDFSVAKHGVSPTSVATVRALALVAIGAYCFVAPKTNTVQNNVAFAALAVLRRRRCSSRSRLHERTPSFDLDFQAARIGAGGDFLKRVFPSGACFQVVRKG